MGLWLGQIPGHKEVSRRPGRRGSVRWNAAGCSRATVLSVRSTVSRAGLLHLSLLVLWVGLAVDEPAPAPLHQVAALAALLEDTLGLEAQGGLQAERRARGEAKNILVYKQITLE